MGLFKNKKIIQLEQQMAEVVQSKKSLQSQVSTLQSIINVNLGVQFINDNISIYPTFTTSDQVQKYLTSDHVYSVINKIAETTSLIPFYTYYEVADKKSMRNYEIITNRQFYTSKGIFDIRLMQIKALVDAPDTDPLEMLMETPNPFQSKCDFFLGLYTYYLLNGEAFVYKVRLDGGANTGKIKEMYLLPPDNVVIRVTRNYPYTITGYDFIVNGQTVFRNIPITDIIHLKKFRPARSFDGLELRGFSPLATASKLLSVLDSGDDAAVKQLQNGGTPGILFDETIANEEVEQSNLDAARNHLYSFITNPDNKMIPYYSAGRKGYIPLGLKLADLDVINLQKYDFKRLCNLYKISDVLFNSDAASTESNVREMIKQMYTNACLPLAYVVRDKLNKELAIEFQDKQRYLDIDISMITELQDDMQQLANVLAALPVTPTGNEMRSLFKFDRIEGIAEMDKPLVKQGYSLIDELSIAPVDPAMVNSEYALAG